MQPCIARAPVKICDVNSEQPVDLFCTKKITNLYKRDPRVAQNWCHKSELEHQQWLHPSLFTVYGLMNESGEKWRLTGIIQYFPKKNLTFQSPFYMLRMKFNIKLTHIMEKIFPLNAQAKFLSQSTPAKFWRNWKNKFSAHTQMNLFHCLLHQNWIQSFWPIRFEQDPTHHSYFFAYYVLYILS